MSAAGATSTAGATSSAGTSGSAGASGFGGATSGAGGGGGSDSLNTGAAGATNPNCPAASASPGALDTTFGSGGIALASEPAGGDERMLTDLALAQDGSAFALGNNSDAMVLCHLGKDGALDTAFGSAGFALASNALDSGYALAVDAQGNVLVGGSNITDAWVERFTSSGRLDPTFGTAGRTTLDFGTTNDRIAKVLVRRDGSLVAAGTSDSNGPTTATMLAFLDRDGAPIPTIGTAGIVQLKPANGRYLVTDLAEEASGALLVFGFVQAPGGVAGHLFWAKVDAQGVLIPSYGQAGFVDGTGKASYAVGLTLDAAGVVTSWAGGSALLAAFDENGSPTPFSATTPLSTKSVALDCAGNVLAAGGLGQGATFFGALGRYSANGYDDASFGQAGFAEWMPASGDTEFVRVRVLPNGRILVAGSSLQAFAVARYLQ
jgi:uncharacterized delta-60 repeat protein